MIIFLIFNFILLIVAFFFIIILYLRQTRLQHLDKKQKSTIKEMEELLSTYLMEMKEENEIFLKKILKFDVQGQKDNVKRPQALVNTNPQKQKEENTNENRTKEKNVLPHIDIQIGEKDIGSLLPNYQEQHVEQMEKSEQTRNIAKMGSNIPSETAQKIDQLDNGNLPNTLVGQIVQLQKQGLSIDKIAKQLNKGKTEIELLLKFQQN